MTTPHADQGDRERKAYSILDDRQLNRISEFGVAEDIFAGQMIYRLGDEAYDLVVIESGAIEIVREASSSSPEEVIATFGPRGFLGELGILTGQSVYLSARAVENGRIHRLSPEKFRSLMATDAQISDLLLAAFEARRDILMGAAAGTIEIIGSAFSAESMSLRTYVARLELPHRWLDVDTPAAASRPDISSLSVDDLPAVFLPGAWIRKATPERLAQSLGLSYRQSRDEDVDLVVIGGGPAGLAATVYGSSEGLSTIMLDAVGPGGQAAASSRIENYLGFPHGVSGAELTKLASIQALKFGARMYFPSKVTTLDTSGEQLRVSLFDGMKIFTRAVIIATGAHYRSLPIARWSEFENAGIYYACTELEVRSCAGREVVVAGGANSAGQAALFLSSRGCTVDLVVRREDIGARMSSYLVNRIASDPMISVRTSTEITALEGTSSLEAVRLTNSVTGEEAVKPCRGLFCFIGADPASGWLYGDCSVDENGFIHTDAHIPPEDLGQRWQSLGRGPLPFETSIPGVFAAGDVRHGSIKRVAAAVGEGASAVSSVHQVVGVRL
ncbi:FAD-dependent oxidoreductase [Streptomyces decoyicus]